jgi:hypothetical protein
MSAQQQIAEHTKTAGDVIAGGVALATLTAWLPPLAALASLVYACLRIYEWFEKRRKR